MRLFTLTDEQQKKVDEFKDKHSDCYDKMSTSTDGKHHISYIVTPGGVGTTISVRCNHCGEIMDITEYNKW